MKNKKLYMSTEKFINTQYDGLFKFVKETHEKCELKDNEYYITLVTDNFHPDNPHIKAIDTVNQRNIVGIERTSTPDKFYISKDFYKIDSPYRGTTCVVEVNDIEKCWVLPFS